MLDLIIATDLVRQKTRESLATEGATKPTRRRDRRRSNRLRSGSASALRGLADRIEPSRPGAVAG